MKNKKICLFLFSSALFIFLVNSVLAQNIGDDFNKFVGGVKDILKPIFQLLVGNKVGEELVKYSLLFILLLLILGIVLMEIPLFRDEDRTGVAFFIALILTILAIRFVPEGFVKSVIVPYTTLGAAILVIFPFIIFFYFLKVFGIENTYARKFAWIIYGAIMLSLLISTYENSAHWIYWWGIALSIFMLWFDGKLQKFIVGMSHERAKTSIIKSSIIKLRRELRELYKDLAEVDPGSAEYNDINNKIKEKEKLLKRLMGKIK